MEGEARAGGAQIPRGRKAREGGAGYWKRLCGHQLTKDSDGHSTEESAKEEELHSILTQYSRQGDHSV